MQEPSAKAFKVTIISDYCLVRSKMPEIICVYFQV